jgi:hypothetical protein
MLPDAGPTEKDWMLATLRELTEIGMELARDLQAQVRQAGGQASADAALRFSRYARVVRQGVALYGLVLQDGLVAARPAGPAQTARPPTEKDIAKGHEVRRMGQVFGKAYLTNLAPPEAIEVFDEEIAEWMALPNVDHLYVDRAKLVVAEVILMLGLPLPKGWRYHDDQQAMIVGHAAGEAQPWRATWAFLRDRVRPHLAACRGYTAPTRAGVVGKPYHPPPMSADDLILAEGP